MAVSLLLAAAVIFVCVGLNRLSHKMGIPMLLAFILLGMFFGSDGILKIDFADFKFAESICSAALIFIMFYGGFGTKWSEAKPVAAKAILLSSLGTVLTAAITGLFCYFVLDFKLLESFLIGSVISSTDAASVFSILRSKKLGLRDNTASLLEVESGSNDPFSYMLTVIILSLMEGQSTPAGYVYMIFAQIAYAVVLGVVISLAALWVLQKFNFATDGFDTIFVFAVALISYAIPNVIGGNGYLCVYIVGIVLGNSKLRNKKAMVHFFDGLTGLMQMLIFFLLGLLCFPSQMTQSIVPAMLIALFLTFAARPVAVFLIMGPFRCKLNQQVLVAWSGLRGAASIVFAIMAYISPAYTQSDIFHIVFCIVLFSILVQGSLIPFVAKKLNMIDEEEDVLKTFTDYSNEKPIQFIQFEIKADHPWNGSAIKDIVLPPGTLIVLQKRGDKHIAPRGSSVIETGDMLVMSADAFENIDGVNLTEIVIERGNSWTDKKICEIDLEDDKLIIMIQRGKKTIIPTGDTILRTEDVLVINTSA